MTWGDDGTIVGAGSAGLFQVAASGGEPELLAESVASPGEFLRYGQPHMLPGSNAILFHASRSYDPEQTDIVALDIATRTQKTVLRNAMDPLYLQTGHLLFVREGTLMAVRFDPERVEVRGDAVIMLEGIMHSIYMPNARDETGAAQVAVSAAGHLAYALGGVYPEKLATAVRVTSTGDTVTIDLPKREYLSFRVSPDGNRLAFVARHGRSNEIWVHDLVQGGSRRLNTGAFSNWPMEWSPDSRSLAFSSDRDQARRNLYRIAVDGGEPERLVASERAQTISSWSSNGVIAFLEAGDIWVLPPDGNPAPFLTSGSREGYATFSPDGQWLAYVSNQSGQREVYVRPYPGPEPATSISGDGGTNPAWSADGRQIFYHRGGVLMAVDVTPGDEFQVGPPAPLLDPWTFTFSPVRGYDVFSDGSFIFGVPDQDESQSGTNAESRVANRLKRFGATELHVILNWVEELKDRVGN